MGWAALVSHELQRGEDLAALLGVMVSVCSITPRPSPQAYVNQFKFQSITADDTLGFFLEYFPELKEKGVDSIPGQHGTFLHVGLQFFSGDAAAATGFGSDGGSAALASPGSGTNLGSDARLLSLIFPYGYSPCSARVLFHGVSPPS